jgi:hypothetical protein
MNRKKLNKLRLAVERLRLSSPKAFEIQKLAKQLGRRRVKRGSEPTWESQEFLTLNVLSIPDHGGKDLSPGVRNSVLTQLEDDLIAWDERLTQHEKLGRGANGDKR